MFDMPLNRSFWSPELNAYGEQQWSKFLDKVPADAFKCYQDELICAFTLSDFIFETFSMQPLVALEWLKSGSLQSAMTPQRIAELIKQAIQMTTSEESLMSLLRRARRQVQCHIIWRDLMGLASLDEVLAATSALADEAIIQARDWLHQDLEKRWGSPCSQDGEPQTMQIIGMGKLGGRELNVSSDVDLIFTYPHGGMTQGVRRERENQEFFIRLGQRLIHVLNQVTVDGAVFRVDMRLRPFGDSGPLVIPFSALEDYYQHQAREWERYAMVKARVLGAPSSEQQQIEQLLQPFVYRRYIDFSAFQSLRKMKVLIQQEVKRRQLDANIKLGAGGIREVEFVAQAQQLMRGGKEPKLRCKGLLETLTMLESSDLLPQEQVKALQQGYRYLRKLEHALQGVADEQTQTLPQQTLRQLRVAAIMGCNDWAELLQQLDTVRKQVHDCFEAVIGEEQGEVQASASTLKAMPLWPDVWQDELIEAACHELVPDDSSVFFMALKNFYDKTRKRQLGPRGRDAIEKLMPMLLAHVCEQTDPAKQLQPVLGVIETILTRTTYIELLLESPAALIQLIQFCHASSWIAQQLARHPMLLDELLDPAQLVKPTPLDAYGDELRQFMLRVAEDDLEQQMEALRHFKQIQQLRIAAADVSGALPIMKVSDHLTQLAEVLLGYCIHLAWQQLVERFGAPTGVDHIEDCMAVIGYGKMGGLELGYSSDLDVVFFHTLAAGMTQGDKSIEHHHFLVKLVQRACHLMTTRTHSGELYEIDLRLRPSGASGVLITHLTSWADYQKKEAWVWEHQALARTRMVFGCKALAQAFSSIRREILCLPRTRTDLAIEVVKMRHKMREHLGSHEDGVFDLKQDEGGIADIEFLAQYLVLGFGHQYPDMAFWPDNVRIFETAKTLKLLTQEQADQLIAAYCNYRIRSHRLSLQCEKIKVTDSEFSHEKSQVKAIWQLFFADAECALADS